MPTYRKKPVEIEAFELGKQRIPSFVTIEKQDGVYKVYNKLHNSWIETKIGDMIRIDQAPDDVYPIDRETFENTYEPV